MACKLPSSSTYKVQVKYEALIASAMNGAIAVNPVEFFTFEMRPTNLTLIFTGSLAFRIEGWLWTVKRERNRSLPVFPSEEVTPVDTTSPWITRFTPHSETICIHRLRRQSEQILPISGSPHIVIVARFLTARRVALVAHILLFIKFWILLLKSIRAVTNLVELIIFNYDY